MLGVSVFGILSKLGKAIHPNPTINDAFSQFWI